MQLLWNVLTDFMEIFKNSINGKFDSERSKNLDEETCSGGTIIKNIMNEYT